MNDFSTVLRKINRVLKRENPDINYKCLSKQTITTHKDLNQKPYSIVTTDYFGMDTHIIIEDKD